MTEIRNRKSEARNPKGCVTRPCTIRNSDFGLLSDFGIRISDLSDPRDDCSGAQSRCSRRWPRHAPLSRVARGEEGVVSSGRTGRHCAAALFHYHFLELLAAGIEEICVIVQPGEDAALRAYLEGPGDDYLRRLAKYPELQAEARQMRELAARVSFVAQPSQEGYGHAVYQTEDICKRRNGVAGFGRPSLSRHAGFALPGIGLDGRGFRRALRVGGQSDWSG